MPSPLPSSSLRFLLSLTVLACGALAGCGTTSLPAWAVPDGGEPLDGGSGDAGADAEGESADAGANGDAGGAPEVRLPPAGRGFDYQLGGAYPPPDGVEIVSRDRKDEPAPGLYNLCYVNGFQAQPSEERFWLEQHPMLVLRDGDGDPVIDPDWDELLLDVGSEAKRTELAEIVGDWIAQCRQDGFDAVEIDNLDTYSRSGGRLSEEDAVAFMALLSERAHAEGLAIAQKNATELVDRREAMGTDFVVAEECNVYDECDVYTDAYGTLVLVVEYRRSAFERGCTDFPDLSIVLRDLDVVPVGESGYVYDGC